MKLWLANCTQQDFQVQARIPERASVTIQDCPQGSQILFGGSDLNQKQIDAVLKQLALYGAIRADEISGSLKGKITLLAQIGNPVTPDQRLMVYKHNHGVLQHEGAKTREAAAVGINKGMANRARMSDMVPQTFTETSIIEEKSGTIQDDANVNEGLRVDTSLEDGAGPPPARKSKRPRRAA